MGERDLHVVFGVGQVGSALVEQLVGTSRTVRAVSQRRPSALAEGTDWRAADVADVEAATDAAKGASVIYQQDAVRAWSRRVRRVGGFIQVGFAAFWLIRGSLNIHGSVGTALPRPEVR